MKKILMLLFGVAVIFVLSGCGGSKEDNSNQTQTDATQDQKQDAGYIDGMLNVKKQAEKNINNAVNQENNKINETMDETNNDYAKKYNAAEIETNLGKIKVKLYNSDSPITVNNFLKLADQKFYDGTKFHRVIKDFMIQGGDPNSKTGDPSTWGTGGPGYSFKDEFNSRKLVRGSLAMANSGPNTNGSQFFIVTAEATDWLDGKHTNFGEVISGIDVVDKIETAKIGAQDRPLENVVIESIILLNMQ